MELNNNFNVDKIQELPEINFIDNLTHNLILDMRNYYDDMLAKFLEDNGYEIKKPYDINQLKQIAKDLEKQDKFIDMLEYQEFDNESQSCIFYSLPFFNSISNPLSEECRQEILNKFIKSKKEGKN